MTVVANDNSNPARSGFAEVFITIIRDQFPPFFVREPYAVQISEYTSIGSTVFNVTAIDNDLVVNLFSSNDILVFKTSRHYFCCPLDGCF